VCGSVVGSDTLTVDGLQTRRETPIPTAPLSTKRRCSEFVLVVLLAAAVGMHAQGPRGELRIEVHDPQGAAVASTAELVSDGNQFRRNFQIAHDGQYFAQNIPFGVYRLSVKAEGFAIWADVLEVRSEVPIHVAVTLGLAPVTTQVEVTDSVMLVDPNRTGTQYSIGNQALAENVAGPPGRALSRNGESYPFAYRVADCKFFCEPHFRKAKLRELPS
jgi:hypothetical protein